MTTVTVGLDDPGLDGLVPREGALVHFRLSRARENGDRYITSEKWTMIIDADGTGTTEVPDYVTGVGVLIDSSASGLGAQVAVAGYPTGTISLVALINGYQVDPSTLLPLPAGSTALELIDGVRSTANAATAAAADAASDASDAKTTATDVAVVVNDGRLSPTALSTTFAPTVYVRDVRDFLNVGETLDTTNTTDVAAIGNRALTALGVEYQAQSGTFGKVPYVLHWPAGDFALISDSLRIPSGGGVGLSGQSMNETRFWSRAALAAVTMPAGFTPASGNPFVDVHFSDFTIRGDMQTYSNYVTSIKGIFLQFSQNLTADRVRVFNCWATGFGTDHMQNAVFTNCTANGNGRGITAMSLDPSTVSGGSGFGFGTGGYLVEDVHLVNCIAKNNVLYGVFLEKQTSVGNWSKGAKVTGCHFEGNWMGVKDCGQSGALITGNTIINNKAAGFALDSTILAPQSGYDGRFASNVLYGNGVTPGSMTACNILLGNLGGGYDISDNNIIGGPGHGIFAGATAVLSGGLTILRNRITGHAGDGIKLSCASTDLAIDGNRFKTNTGYDINLDGTVTAIGMEMTSNDLRASGVRLAQTLDPTYFITGNRGFDPTAPTNVQAVASGSTSLSLSWVAPIAGTPTGYSVQYRLAGATSWTNWTHTGTAVTDAITGLQAGDQYQVQIASVTAAGTSVYASASAFTGALLTGDTFTRADTATSLGTMDSGSSPKPWSGTSFKIATNQAAAVAADGHDYFDAGVTDRTIEATVTTWSGAAAVGLHLRFTDVNNFLHIGRGSDGHWQFQQKVAGTFTGLFNTQVALAQGQTVRVSCHGDTYRFYINGVFVGSYTTAQFDTVTQAGMHAATPVTVDNFHVYA